MGVLVDTEANGGKGPGDAIVGKIRGSLSDPTEYPVIYKLVRVDGDGRFVPATDDDVVKVEQLLENDKNEMPSAEGPCHSEGCVSSEALSSKKFDFEGSEGRSQNRQLNSQKFNARLEYIEVMLQKVNQEEQLRLSCEPRDSRHSYNQLARREKFQSENSLLETDSHTARLNASQEDQSEFVETCPEAATESFTCGLPSSELSANLKAKISILKGEICLDNLTIRELQEVFKATFGRETTVKDKLWLKRHLAMGLSNSYDHPLAYFVHEEEKVVDNEEKEVSFCWFGINAFESDSLSKLQDNGLGNYPCLESSAGPTKQMKVHPVFSGKELRRSVVEYDVNDEHLQVEQVAAKRVRKPTKRYIEELPEIETRECIDTICCSVKNSGPDQHSPISRIWPVQNIGSQGNTFVTRQDSLGGSNIQIPCVSRVRRGLPRKNYTSLMNIDVMENKTNFIEPPSIEEEQDLKHRKTDSSGDVSDKNANTMPALKCVARRKHHRAWTLTEVMKLVEGVARYGTGRWSEIKRMAFDSHAYRTSVDLKDKWRNLLKASFAQESSEKGVRKLGSMSIPRSTLLRVRELAEIHSQPRVESGHSKFVGHGGRALQGRASAFL